MQPYCNGVQYMCLDKSAYATYGGSFIRCVFDIGSVVNPMTGGYSCPSGYD